MKIDILNTLIVAAVAGLLAWGGYTMTDVSELKIYVAVVTFLTLFTSGMFSVGMKTAKPRSAMVIRFTSGAFFLLFCVINLVFTFFDFSKPLYIIINAIALLLLLIIAKSVTKSGM